MTYEAYEARVKRLAAVLAFIRAKKAVFLTALVAVLSLAALFVATRGMLLGGFSCPESFVFGEEFTASARAFLGDAQVEVSVPGSDVWGPAENLEPGTYLARAVSRRSFGFVQHGAAQQFTVVPKTVAVRFGEAPAVYGGPFTAEAALPEGYSFLGCGVSYTSDDGRLYASPDLASARVRTADGRDVSGLFDFCFDGAPVPIRALPITVASSDESFEYDRTVHHGTGVQLLTGELVEGDVLQPVFTAALTTPGTVENSFGIAVVNSRGEDVTAFYSLSSVYGSLTVTPRRVVITTDGAEKEYDRLPLTVLGWKITEGSLLAGDRFTVLEDAVYCDPGTYENVPVRWCLSDAADNDVAELYALEFAPGRVEIRPRSITVRGPSLSCVYDGKEHCVPDGEWTVIGGSLLEGDRLMNLKKAVCTDPCFILGYSEWSIRNGDLNVNYCYDVHFEGNRLEITPRVLTVRTGSAEKTFDGSPLLCTETELADPGVLLPGHKLDLTFEGALWGGTFENLPSGWSVREEGTGEDRSMFYTLQVEPGTLTVHPRPVTISIAARRAYNASAEVSEANAELSVTVLSGSFPEGYEPILFCTSASADVGTHALTVSEVFWGGIDCAGSYDFTLSDCTLTVEPRPVTTLTESGVHIYDGRPFSVSGFSLADGLDPILCDGHTIELVSSEVRTLAGGYPNLQEYRIRDAAGHDVTFNYAVTVRPGFLIIRKRQIALISDSGSAVYDGMGHSVPSFTVDESGAYFTDDPADTGLLPGHTVRVNGGAEYVDAGTYPVELTYLITDANGADVTASYDNRAAAAGALGTLTIQKRSLTVISPDAEKVYDGKPLYTPSLSLEAGQSLPDAHSLYFNTDRAQLTNAGSMENGYLGDVRIYRLEDDETSTDVTRNFELYFHPGRLTVLPRPVTIRTASATFMYDGQPHSVQSCSIVSELGPAEGETFVFSHWPSFRNAGEYENRPGSYSIMKEDNKKAGLVSNYDLTYECGTITIEKRPLFISPDSKQWIYDGETHFLQTFRYLDGTSPLPGHYLTVVSSSELTEVGCVQNYFYDYLIENVDGLIVTENYDIIFDEESQISVVPRPVTLRTASAEKLYDGKTLSRAKYEITSELGFLDAHRFTVRESSSLRGVGSIENVFSVTSVTERESGRDVSRNYKITYETPGILTVTPRELVIRTGTSAQMIGMGGSIFDNRYEILSGTLAEGQEIRVTEYTTLSVLGRVPNVLELSVFDDPDDIEETPGTDVTQNYVITYEYGTLHLAERGILLKTDSLEAGYDGEPHSQQSYQLYELILDGKGLPTAVECPGLVLTEIESPALTRPGKIENCFTSFRILDMNDGGRDVTDLYAVQQQEWGTVEVGVCDLRVQSGSAKKGFDTKPLTCTEYEFLAREIPERQKLVVTESASQTEIGTCENVFYQWRVFDLITGEDVTDCYSFDFVWGTLFVTTSSPDAKTDEPPFQDTYSLRDPLSVVTNNTPIYLKPDGFDDRVLLRGISYADYDENGTWTVAPPYTGPHSPLTYAGLSLSGDRRGGMLTVNTADQNAAYLPPLSSAIPGGSTSDNVVVQNQYQYTVPYAYGMLPIYFYAPGTYGISLPAELAEEEAAYSVYVTDTYLTIPSSLRPLAEALVANGGLFGVHQSRIPETVVKFLQSQYVYTETERTVPEGIDPVIYFLRYSGCGSSREFAAAATLLFRALGLPARYTVGYAADVKSGQWTEARGSDTYAWVEIYVSGYGWVTIDVCAGQGSEKGTSGGTGGTPGGSQMGYPTGSNGLAGGDSAGDPIITLQSSVTGVIYLRYKCFGEYSGTSSWGEAPVYTGRTVNPNTFAGCALQDGGYDTVATLKLQYNRPGGIVLPYFVYDYPDTKNDVLVDWGNRGDSYSQMVPFIPATLSEILSGEYRVPASLRAEEQEYRRFVHENYLSVPSSTRQALLALAAENGLRADSPTLIADVQNYIQHAAHYDMTGDAYPEGSDMVVYFLTEAKYGICQQFAAAAVMMYRTLGIPARWTTGYLAVVEAHKLCEVQPSQAHAWAEVYIDGMGWVAVEVTGSFDPDGGYAGDPGADVDPGTEDPDSGRPEQELMDEADVVVEFYGISVTYDGWVHLPEDGIYRVIKGSIPEGYHLEFRYSESPMHAGTYSVGVTAMLIGAEGDENYLTVYCRKAVVTIKPRAVTIRTADSSKIYDGRPLTCGVWWVVSGSIPDGNDSVSLQMSGSQTEIGSSENRVAVVNFTKKEMARDYDITIVPGTLTVLAP